MSKIASKRRDSVLKIIVSEYIATANPVASEAILRHHSLGVSPATIRNDMASLEEDGYISRPYTSSGGVPLDKGYRFYVESISQSQELAGEEQKRIRQVLDSAVDEYDRLLRLAASTVAKLVGNAAIVTFPRSPECKFKHLEAIAVHPYMAMLILILRNAVLRRQTISFDSPVPSDQLEEAATRLNREYAGLTKKQITEKKMELSNFENKISTAIYDLMSSEDATGYESSYLEGLRLMLGQPEFIQRERMLGVLELIEAREWVKRVVDWQVSGSGVNVIIGEENRDLALRDLSLVMSNYGVSDQARGALGIIGPKRMDYPRTIAAVNYVSGLLSELVARVCEGD